MPEPASPPEKPLAPPDPSLRQDYEDLLAGGFRFLRFPRTIERQFARTYQQLAMRGILSHGPYLLGLYLLLGAVATFQFRDNNPGYFVPIYLLSGACLLTCGLMTRLHLFERWFNQYIGLTATAILTGFLVVRHTPADAPVVGTMQAVVIYATIMIYALSKMRFYSAVFYCLLAGMASYSWLSLSGYEPAIFNFSSFYMANLIGMGISYITEHRERTLFLQRNLREIEREETRQLNEHLERLSREDSLTRLANRRYFSERYELEWKRCVREKLPVSLILLDIDFFKQYNDTYGHLAGDLCLTQVARALEKEASRPGELVGRYGGEEFIMLYPNVDSQQIENTVLRVIARLKDLAIPHDASRVAKIVTASLGVATTFPTPKLQPEKLINAADQALYAAKDNGRNGWARNNLESSAPEQQSLISLSN